MHPGPASDVERPVRSRRHAVAINAGIIVGAICVGSLASQAADIRLRHATLAHPVNEPVSVLFVLLSWGCAVLLCFRHRRGFLLPTALVACLPPLFLPLDAFPALVGLASLLVWHRNLVVRLVMGFAVTAATFASIWRDSRGTAPGASFWNGLVHGQRAAVAAPMPWWQVTLFTAMCVGTFAGVALFRRGRLHRVRADARADAASRTASSLGRQVAEHDEREALAREVHDVLGHRLSLLSMQANALEVEAAEADEAVRQRARAIQSGAAESMDDLRSLLHVMRAGPAPLDRPADLSDIAVLVRECIAAGTPVASSIFVDRSQPIDDVISRSAHRITAELLTNARKHAPGALLTLEVHATPSDGVTIHTENAITQTPAGVGTGSGLVGVERRVHDVGGTFRAGVSDDHRRFLATAQLPWNLTHTPQERS